SITADLTLNAGKYMPATVMAHISPMSWLHSAPPAGDEASTFSSLPIGSPVPANIETEVSAAQVRESRKTNAATAIFSKLFIIPARREIPGFLGAPVFYIQ
ncbi:MAG: hypothetical protein AAB339_00905, partial [Elusimicrobiota bacterium]